MKFKINENTLKKHMYIRWKNTIEVIQSKIMLVQGRFTLNNAYNIAKEIMQLPK